MVTSAVQGNTSTPPAPLPLPQTVLPGDDLTPHILTPTIRQPPKLGTGLSFSASNNTITATLAGRLVHRPSSSTYFIATNTRRYQPSVGDRVVGIVEDKMSAEYYRVNIFGPHPALLHHLAFEGATKRNKPHLEPGTLLYCRVVTDHRDMDPEVSCKVGGDGFADGGAKRKDWMTDEGTYGPLRGGTCSKVSIGLARELLLPQNVVLNTLGKYDVPFEVCIGVNGMVWVHSSRPEYTIMVLNAIRNSEVMTESQVRGMVKSLIETVRSSLEE